MSPEAFSSIKKTNSIYIKMFDRLCFATLCEPLFVNLYKNFDIIQKLDRFVFEGKQGMDLYVNTKKLHMFKVRRSPDVRFGPGIF